MLRGASGYPKNPAKCLRLLMIRVEPMVGIEPTTYGLRNRCSTTELHWQPCKRTVNVERHSFTTGARGLEHGHSFTPNFAFAQPLVRFYRANSATGNQP